MARREVSVTHSKVGRDDPAQLPAVVPLPTSDEPAPSAPPPLPWSNVSAALGGGLWGGTLVTLVGDTGTGKTQWALQAAIHAAESGVPVCYVASESAVDQRVARARGRTRAR